MLILVIFVGVITCQLPPFPRSFSTHIEFTNVDAQTTSSHFELYDDENDRRYVTSFVNNVYTESVYSGDDEISYYFVDGVCTTGEYVPFDDTATPVFDDELSVPFTHYFFRLSGALQSPSTEDIRNINCDVYTVTLPQGHSVIFYYSVESWSSYGSSVPTHRVPVRVHAYVDSGEFIFDYINFIADVTDTDHLFEAGSEWRCPALVNKACPMPSHSFKMDIEMTDFIEESSYYIREFRNAEDNVIRIDEYIEGDSVSWVYYPDQGFYQKLVNYEQCETAAIDGSWTGIGTWSVIEFLMSNPESNIYYGKATVRNILAERWIATYENVDFYGYQANFTAEIYFTDEDWNTHDGLIAPLRLIFKGSFGTQNIEYFHVQREFIHFHPLESSDYERFSFPWIDCGSPIEKNIPDLPVQYRTVIEFTDILQNQTDTFHIEFDQIGARMRATTYNPHEYGSTIWFFDSGLQYDIIRDECETKPIPDDEMDFYNVDGIVNPWIRLFVGTEESYQGTTTIRGIPADHWHAPEFTWEQGGDNFTAVALHYFSVDGWADLESFPIRTIVRGTVTSAGETSPFSWEINYFNWESKEGDLFIDSDFVPPHRVFCEQITQSSLPTLPNQWKAYIEEKDALGVFPIATFVTYYDSDNGFYRRDEVGENKHVTIIIDANTNTQHTIDQLSYECDKEDAENGLVTDDGLIPTWEFFHFGASYDPRYVGNRHVRNIDCDVWMLKTSSDGYNLTYFWYFSDENWSIFQKSETQREPVRLEIVGVNTTTGLTTLDAVYDIFSFEHEVKSSDFEFELSWGCDDEQMINEVVQFYLQIPAQSFAPATFLVPIAEKLGIDPSRITIIESLQNVDETIIIVNIALGKDEHSRVVIRFTEIMVETEPIYGYRVNRLDYSDNILCEECDHGNCFMGHCKCHEGYYGIRCTEEIFYGLTNLGDNIELKIGFGYYFTFTYILGLIFFFCGGVVGFLVFKKINKVDE